MNVAWHLVTGEYPPQRGGVADYSHLVAQRLVLEGERVRVWTGPGGRPAPDDGKRGVRRLPHGFGIRSLAALGRELDASDAHRRLFVQYVPQAFGYRGMNLAFCLWLARRREPVWTMFHEVIFPRLPHQPVRHRVLAAVTRVMAAVVARAAERVFVSTPAWAAILASIAPDAPAAEWLPVPSTIARLGNRDDARAIRERYGRRGGPLIGHFGSGGPLIDDQLGVAIPALLERVPGASVVLLGGDGEALRRHLVDLFPALSRKLWATGRLTARDVSLHLLACDVMVQPFAEGVTTRRTSVMAALAHGVPTVTTSGRLTEPLWWRTRAVELAPAGDPTALATLTAELLADRARRERIGAAGRLTYDALFDVRHTIATLRGPVGRMLDRAEALAT